MFGLFSFTGCEIVKFRKSVDDARITPDLNLGPLSNKEDALPTDPDQKLFSVHSIVCYIYKVCHGQGFHRKPRPVNPVSYSILTRV